MAVAQSFSLQNLHDFYKSSRSNTNTPNLSYFGIADLFILEHLVISDGHQKVHQAFKHLNSKIQRHKNQIRKFAKFKDDEGEKVMLEVLTSAMDTDYDSQVSEH